VLGVVALVATFVIWIELMVRSSLIYLLVAFSPLVFAASVWPSARGMLRRLVELLLAVILSKLAISIALSVGVAALGGTVTPGADGGVGEFAAQSLGNLVVGTAILAMAAFSPFIILKLIPVAEAAVVAQGISRAPLNTARSGMNTAYYGQSLGRLAGMLGNGGGGDAPADADGPSFGEPDLAGGDLAGDAGAEGAGELAGAAGGAEAGGGAGAAAGGSAAAGTAAAGVVAAPVAAAAIGVAAAKEAKDTAEETAESAANQAADATGSGPGGGSDVGWRQVPNTEPERDPSEPMPVDPQGPPAAKQTPPLDAGGAASGSVPPVGGL
jgi:hypothetical protein